MLVRSEDVAWTDIWNTVGLRGTASDQFALDDFFVRSDHSITREFDQECRENGPLYRMGNGTCYQVGFAGVACGIARSALDSFLEITRKVPRGARNALRENAVVQSNLAQADASTAWCLSQAGGCAMSAAYLDLPVAHAIFGNDPRAVLAWGPGPRVRAVECEGGYKVTGVWAFASGGRHATWLGAHCPIYAADGSPKRDANGEIGRAHV